MRKGSHLFGKRYGDSGYLGGPTCYRQGWAALWSGRA